MNNKEKYFILKQAIIAPAIVGGTIGAATKDEGEGTGEQFARGAGVGVMTDAGLGLGALAGGGIGAGGGYGLGKLIEAIQSNEDYNFHGHEDTNKTTELLTMLGMLGGGALGAGGGAYGGYRLGRNMLMPPSKEKKEKEEKNDF